MVLDYKIIYSNRKSLRITVERDCSIVVCAPEGTDPEKIRELVESKKIWIYQKQRHPQKYSGTKTSKEFVSGESVRYLGMNYILDINQSGDPCIQLNDKFIICDAGKEDLKKNFRDWFVERAKEKISPRIAYFARKMGVEYNRIMISDLRYRWGSCTPKNNLNFNWRLIKAPMPVIDYVIAHELAHLIEPNHTTRFWNVVKAQIPMYQMAKNWLKEHGEVLEEDF